MLVSSPQEPPLMATAWLTSATFLSPMNASHIILWTCVSPSCLNVPQFHSLPLSLCGSKPPHVWNWASWNPPPDLVLLDMSFAFHFPFKNVLSLCFKHLTRMLSAGFSQSSPAECRHSLGSLSCCSPQLCSPLGLVPAAFEAWGGRPCQGLLVTD